MSCDWDPAKVYRQQIRRAAKDYKCDECRGVIRKGERYEYTTGCWDGYWDDFHTCSDCIPIRCEIARIPGGCGGWLHGGMLEELQDMRWQPENHRIIGMYNASIAHRGGLRVDIPSDEDA